MFGDVHFSFLPNLLPHRRRDHRDLPEHHEVRETAEDFMREATRTK
jgi:hypothetical protein